MLELTYDNHFRFGFDRQWFRRRSSLTDQWTVEYGRPSRKPLGFKEECLRASRLVFEKSQGQLWLLFSGGIDSEVMVRSFHNAKIPFSVAILRFNNDLNIHDISYAVIVCEELGIPYRLIDLDVLTFYKSGRALDYALEGNCSNPRLLPLLWVMDKLDGYPVVGSGECYLAKRALINKEGTPYSRAQFRSTWELDSDSSAWDLWEREAVASLYFFLMKKDKSGCPGFFQFTPEIIASQLQEPLIKEIVSNRLGKLDSLSSKHSFYSKYFHLRPRKKYNGFEKMMLLNQEYRLLLKERLPGHNEIYRTPYALVSKTSLI